MTEPQTAAGAGVRVLYRDADLMALYKPSGLPTTSPDGKGCLTEIAAQLDRSAPRLHASSRLDAEVSGVVTFARTKRAIEALLAARQAGRYERFYLGLMSGCPTPAEGRFDWSIERDPRDPRRRVALPAAAADSGRRGLHAFTHYQVLHTLPTAALVLMRPMTGRTHQLRVHSAQAGWPLLGDRHYGGPVQCTLADGRVVRAKRVMLHCARVRLPRVGRQGDMPPLSFDAPLPDDFGALWGALGGELDALNNALV